MDIFKQILEISKSTLLMMGKGKIERGKEKWKIICLKRGDGFYYKEEDWKKKEQHFKKMKSSALNILGLRYFLF